jgi:translation initiation factor IF-3
MRISQGKARNLRATARDGYSVSLAAKRRPPSLGGGLGWGFTDSRRRPPKDLAISSFPPRRPPFASSRPPGSGPRPGGFGGDRPRRDGPSMGPRMNDRIRITPIRLIDQDGEMVGIVETDEARQRAMEAGLDLVEISPDARPPVCKIMDYGKFKYEEAKKNKANKSKTSELKEVRLGRSMKIDPHDVDIRVQQARRFLLEGHKVQLVASYKGREMAHRELGERKVNDVINRLLDLGKLEAAPRLNGKRINAIIAPDKNKIEQWKRKEQAAGRKGVIEEVTVVDEPDEGDDE